MSPSLRWSAQRPDAETSEYSSASHLGDKARFPVNLSPTAARTTRSARCRV